MVDLGRIKSNVSKMASMNAPEADIDGYIQSEGSNINDVKNYNPDSGIQNAWPTYPLIKQGVDIAFNKAPAAIREALRSPVSIPPKPGQVETAQKNADNAFQDPSSSPTFQQENLKNTNDAISKTNPTAGTAQRYYAGLLPSAAGVAEDFVTNPGQVITSLATDGLTKALSPVEVKGLTLGERANYMPISKLFASSEGQAGKSALEASKAASATESLLQPGGNFSKDIKAGKTSNMVTQASKYISPAKNYTDVTDQMELAKGFPMQERQNVYDSNSAVPSRSHLDKLNELISNESNPESNPQAGSSASNLRLKQYNDIQTAEADNLNQLPNDKLNDPQFWQDRKAYYQDQANKAGAYGGNEKMSARAEAYQALAQGAQDKTYSLADSVKPLNLENAGLDEASTRASELAAVERGAAPKNMPQDVIDKIHPSKEGVVKSVGSFARHALTGDHFDTVPVLTRRINNASNASESAQRLADFIESIKVARGDKATLDFPKQLPAPEQAQIGVNKRSVMSNLLPPGQGSGPTILMGDNGRSPINLGDTPNYPEHGNLPAVQQPGLQPKRPSQIELPEHTQSGLDNLAQKWGVQNRNVRSSMNASDIPPVVKSSSTEGLIMSPAKRKAIFDILQRRKQNFSGRNGG